MSHSHRDDYDLTLRPVALDLAREPSVKAPAPTNTEAARAAVQARETETAEDVLAREQARERKFLGDADSAGVRSAGSPINDEELDAVLGGLKARRGPPAPRFESFIGHGSWLAADRFEAVGFASPLPEGTWLQTGGNA